MNQRTEIDKITHEYKYDGGATLVLERLCLLLANCKSWACFFSSEPAGAWWFGAAEVVPKLAQ